MRALRLVLALAAGGLGVAAATAVGASGSSSHVRAMVAPSDQFSTLDPVLNDGTKAVLRALSQGLQIVLASKGKKGGTQGFKQQQTGWNRVKNSYDVGESQFANTANKASDQFMQGVFSISTNQAAERDHAAVFSSADIANELINLLRLISGFEQKMSTAAATWDQVKNTPSWDLTIAKSASAGTAGTGAGAGKATVASGLAGATQLIQTVAKAEVALYEKVAIAEIEYEGGILTAQEAIQQIDAALAAFETAIEGGGKKLLKGAPTGTWSRVMNKTLTPTTATWNRVLNNMTFSVVSGALQVPGTTVTSTTTTSTTSTVTTSPPALTPTQITVTCPHQGAGQTDEPGTPFTVTGSLTPALDGASITITYANSDGSSPVTHTVASGPDGTYTDSYTPPGTDTTAAVAVQSQFAGDATHAASTSAACSVDVGFS